MKISRKHARLSKLTIGAVAVVALISGCSSAPMNDFVGKEINGTCAEEAFTSEAPQGSVTVGYASRFGGPVVQWAEQEGCFAERRVDVEGVEIGGAEALASLTNGAIDVYNSTFTDAILSSTNSGFDMVILASLTGYTLEELERAKQEPLYPDELLLQLALITSPESGISDWGDLEGKIIATEALGDVQALGTSIAATEYGADSSLIEWRVLPGETRLGSLERGEVDAIIVSSTLATEAMKAGMKMVGYPGAYYYSAGPALVWVTTKATYDKKQSELMAFRESVLEAQSFLADSENYGDSFRKILTDFFQLDSGVAAATKMPNYWTEDMEEEYLVRIGKILTSSGTIDETLRLPVIIN